MILVANIVIWLLFVLLPTVLLFLIPLVGWILGLAWMLVGTSVIIKAMNEL